MKKMKCEQKVLPTYAQEDIRGLRSLEAKDSLFSGGFKSLP